MSASASKETGRWSAGSIVLYVEDDEGDAFFMHRAFARALPGRPIRTVSTGEAALDYLTGAGPYQDRSRYPLPAVVLLDLNLPQMHGFEVLQRIRQIPALKALPVVVFSGTSRDLDREAAILLGANAFWQKPGSGDLFTETVRQLQGGWLNPA